MALAQKVIELAPALPESVRLFLDPSIPQHEFVKLLFAALAREKTSQFAGVNRFLESFIGDANRLSEEIANYQLALEHVSPPHPEILDPYDALRRKAEHALMELHRAKMRLNEFKIAVCRFLVIFEAPNRDAIKQARNVEEWMDSATLAEMRLTRLVSQEQNRNLQQQLALFLTFRSVVCSYDGPALYIRQLEGSLSSMQALHEKALLELEVVTATRNLDETRKELSTVKFNLEQMQNQLRAHQLQSEQWNRLVALQEEKGAPWRKWIFLAAGLALVVGLYLLLRANAESTNRKVAGIISQKSCQDIARQIEKSPRYASQVLIFRKYDSDIYFKANAMTCEKLHRLDSTQVGALSQVMIADYLAGHQDEAGFNGHRVLQVKDVGLNTLVVKLMNKTAQDLSFKVRILELATQLKGLLQSDNGEEGGDLLLIDLLEPTPT